MSSPRPVVTPYPIIRVMTAAQYGLQPGTSIVLVWLITFAPDDHATVYEYPDHLKDTYGKRTGRAIEAVEKYRTDFQHEAHG